MAEEKYITGVDERESPPSAPAVIQPEPGRHVHFYSKNGMHGFGFDVVMNRPHAAIIAYVHGVNMVNLSVIDSNGKWFPLTSITLVQPGEKPPEWASSWCEWMPYTQAKAAQG